MELKETIKNRRSIRKFKNTEISKEDFEDTLYVVNECQFDHAFTFIYSKKPKGSNLLEI